MRAVALVSSIALLGCFSNPRHRTIAKVAEGAAIVGGIVLLTTVNTGADCDTGIMPDQDCEDRAQLLSNIGLGLILAGMAGFIVTVSTDPDDDTTTTQTVPATAPPAAPASQTPAPAAEGGTPAPTEGAGSAAPPSSP